MRLLKVGKWGNSVAIRIPASVAKELGIKEGDSVSPDALRLRKVVPRVAREEAIEGIRNTGWKLPEDWKIDRNDPDLRG